MNGPAVPWTGPHTRRGPAPKPGPAQASTQLCAGEQENTRLCAGEGGYKSVRRRALPTRERHRPARWQRAASDRHRDDARRPPCASRAPGPCAARLLPGDRDGKAGAARCDRRALRARYRRTRYTRSPSSAPCRQHPSHLIGAPQRATPQPDAPSTMLPSGEPIRLWIERPEVDRTRWALDACSRPCLADDGERHPPTSSQHPLRAERSPASRASWVCSPATKPGSCSGSRCPRKTASTNAPIMRTRARG